MPNTFPQTDWGFRFAESLAEFGKRPAPFKLSLNEPLAWSELFPHKFGAVERENGAIWNRAERLRVSNTRSSGVKLAELGSAARFWAFRTCSGDAIPRICAGVMNSQSELSPGDFWTARTGMGIGATAVNEGLANEATGDES